MDITEALATIKAVSALTASILNGVIDDKVKAKATELNNSIITLQATIFSIQSENQELLQSNEALKQDLRNISDWNDEKNRYQLVDLGLGAFVYRLKKSEGGSEPIHDICPSCYQKGEKFILQFSAKNNVGVIYKCPGCESIVINANGKRTIAETL